MGCFRGVGGARNLKLEKVLPDSGRILRQDLAQYRSQGLKNRSGGASRDCLRDHARFPRESPIEEGRDPLGECGKNRKSRSRRIPDSLLAIIALDSTLDCCGFSGRFRRPVLRPIAIGLRSDALAISHASQSRNIAGFEPLSKKNRDFLDVPNSRYDRAG
jgi:hypothetical protein